MLRTTDIAAMGIDLSGIQSRDIELSGLDLRRTVTVFASAKGVGNECTPLIMELEMPLVLNSPDDRDQLTELLRQCGELHKADQDLKKSIRVGAFTAISVESSEHLERDAIDAIMDQTLDFMMIVGLAPDQAQDLREISFEVNADLPTQRLFFDTSYTFVIDAKAPDGRIQLEVSYPEYKVYGDKRPIDDVETFLVALGTWWQHSPAVGQVHQELRMRKQSDPDRELDEHSRSLHYNGAMQYQQLTGHGFGRSRAVLTADHLELPVHSDLMAVCTVFLAVLRSSVKALSIV